MQTISKTFIDRGRSLISEMKEKEKQAKILVNEILHRLPYNEPVIFDEPAYILMDDGGSWGETGIRSVRMTKEGMVRLEPWEKYDTDPEDDLWDEDDDSLRVNWVEILRQTVRALEKEAER